MTDLSHLVVVLLWVRRDVSWVFSGAVDVSQPHTQSERYEENVHNEEVVQSGWQNHQQVDRVPDQEEVGHHKQNESSRVSRGSEY